jgi:hypothetical protein
MERTLAPTVPRNFLNVSPVIATENAYFSLIESGRNAQCGYLP